MSLDQVALEDETICRALYSNTVPLPSGLAVQVWNRSELTSGCNV